MRILLVNTSYETGGAAVATKRLAIALRRQGHDVRMLVRDGGDVPAWVEVLPSRFLSRLRFALDRVVPLLLLHGHRHRLWELDTASVGNDITRHEAFRWADVVHLAWVNQGMLSLGGLQKIVASGKPIVWTMHDLWPASSLCHYARGCKRYADGCGYCPLLPDCGGAGDGSHRLWERKKAVYAGSDIHFVTCSEWLCGQAGKSGLLAGKMLTAIPNTIDTTIFHPADKSEMRRRLGLPLDKKIILFVAYKVTDERKGARYMVEALQRLTQQSPQLASTLAVALLGGEASALAAELPVESFPLGYVSGDERLACVYNSADVFVLPSMEDNLPNTIMEAMACGVPCVGFRVGGIPEMIDHERNGYVANIADSDQLAAGLRWVLTHDDYYSLQKEAIEKVATAYAERVVVNKYNNVYRHALARGEHKQDEQR